MAEAAELSVGSRVALIDKGWTGAVAFIGTTSFSEGKWVGVVLDQAKGKNNGVVQGKRYFDCADNHGLFVRLHQLRAAPAGAAKGESGLKQPSQIKKPASRADGDTPRSRLAKSASSQRLSPSPSSEKLKSDAPSSKMATSGSFEKLKQQSLEQTPKTAAGATNAAALSTGIARKISDLHQATSDRSSEASGIMRESLSEGAELEYLRVETRDLAEKLETLRAKRNEDKQKLIDYERCRIQLQQLLEYKMQMTEAHTDLQRQLQQAKKEAREAMEARERHQEDMSGLSEAVEMATLDKEMAEEKCELLQQEADSQKERIQELEMDLEILKGEMQADAGVGAVSDTVQLKQLEQQNERLREALVKMRDLSGQSSQDGQRMSKELETLRAQVTELSKKNEKLTSDGAYLEHQVNDLQEQVDAALGAEQMVEQLTAQNLALEERVRDLEETRDDLEQMRVMDEEMQESARDAERELRQELDLASGRNNELKMQVQSGADRAADLESTIRKFRQRTADLQEQIQDLKDALLRSDASNRPAAADAPGEQRGATPFSTKRAAAQSVEHRLCKVDLDSASQQVKLLRSFLPDNFAKPGGDGDALSVCLAFPRLIDKASALSAELASKYPTVPGGMCREHVSKSHKGEQWGFCAKVDFKLKQLVTIAGQFKSALGRCNVERLARIAQLQPDIAAIERQLDHYFELLKTDRFDENTNLETLDKAVVYLRNLYAAHLANDKCDFKQLLGDNMSQCLVGFSWFRLALQRLQFYLLGEFDGSDLAKLLKDLHLFADESEQFCCRVKNRIASVDAKVELNLSTEDCENLDDTALHVQRAADILHNACKAASTQVSMLPDVDGLDWSRLNEFLDDAVVDLLGKSNEKSAADVLKLSLGIVMAHVSKLADQVDKGQLDVPSPDVQPFPPILERAHLRKQEAVEADGLRWQLEKKDGEAVELKKTLRLRADEISELKVRLDIADKKLATSGKADDDRVVRQQRRIDDLQQDLKKKEREYEQTLDALQQDLETMEAQNTELKERQKAASKRALLQGISREAGIVGGFGSLPSPAAPSHDSPLLISQIGQLKDALRVSENNRWRAAGERMRLDVAALRPLNVPRKAAGPQSSGALLDLDAATQKRHDELSQLTREATKLQKAMLDFVSANRVIDLSKRRAGGSSAASELSTRLQSATRINEWTRDARCSAYLRLQSTGRFS